MVLPVLLAEASAVGIVALIMVAVIVAAIVRGLGSRNILPLAGVLAILLMLGLGVARLTIARHEQIASHEQIETMIAERAAHGEVVPDMYGQRIDMTSHTDPTWVKGGMVLLFLVPVLAFAAAKSCRRSGGKALVLALGVAALLLFLSGWFTIRSRSTTWTSYPQLVQAPLPMLVPPHDVIPQSPAAPEAPIDELYDRLTHPRIALQGHPGEPVPPAADAHHIDAVNAANDAQLTKEQRAAQAAAISTAIEASKLAGAKLKEITAFMSTTGTEASASASNDATAAPVNDMFAPEPKPDWVVNPPKLAGPVQRIVVQAGPYSTRKECEEALRDETRQVVQRRLYDLACEWSGRDVYAPPLERMGLGTSFIDRDVVIDRYFETNELKIGPMQTAWALLEFDPSVDRRLLEAWQSYARRDGIAITAVGSALVLGALGLVFGLIKVDTWTRGYYTKRLFIGVPAAIIAFVMLIAAMS